jgi:RNA polymerase sigma-70 factor (ECF subfamily)
LNGPDYDRLATLMARALNGDACAYEAALRDIARIVRAYARGRLGETIADDVVQDTLLAVHRARHTYDPDRPFGPWLMAIAHSRVVDTARRLRRLRLQGHTLPVAGPAAAGASAARHLSRSRLSQSSS